MNTLYRIAHNHFRDITSIGSPVVLIIILFIKFGISSTFLSLVFGLVSIEIVCSLIKLSYYKPRPIKLSFKNVFDKINASSFPSIHSARVTFVFLVMFFTSGDLIKRIVFIFIIIYVCFSRMYLKKHFFIDVLFGIIVGNLFFLMFNN